jgi:hypothetical protein
MQAMPGIEGVASGRVVSAGATLVFGAGLALYQLTSLVLGPVNSRQLELSLTIPGVETQGLAEGMPSSLTLVVGMRATPAAAAAPASQAMRLSASPRAFCAPTPKASSQPLPAVSPKPKPHPSDKKIRLDDD